ncbi:glycosyltransferase family 62 protein [Xylariaceae sp. FL0594]|nr:glycosyltransferase family 62 protein [Xylariaceae sp. FL0594]
MGHLNGLVPSSNYSRLGGMGRFSRAGNPGAGSLLALFLFIIFIFSTTELRNGSWMCKAYLPCVLPWGQRWTYRHWGTVDPELRLDVYEKTLRDGTLHFHRQTAEYGDPAVLILAVGQDIESWDIPSSGRGGGSIRSTPRRNIHDFLDLLVLTGLDFTSVSLGFLTSSRPEYDAAVRATERLPFARVSIYHTDPHLNSEPGFAYAERHKLHVQRQRRGAIATSRNYLMMRGLRDEQHIVWVDPDVVEISPALVQTMMAHAESHEGVGILTTLSMQTRRHNFDKNAWAFRTNTLPEERATLEAADAGNSTEVAAATKPDIDIKGPIADDMAAAAVSQLDASRVYVDELIENTHDDDLIHIDSVGSSGILYLRAQLVRQGVMFPASNVVGTTWSHEGWYGIEAEGICYVAAQIKKGAGGCFVLGGSHRVRHADVV